MFNARAMLDSKLNGGTFFAKQPKIQEAQECLENRVARKRKGSEWSTLGRSRSEREGLSSAAL